MDDDRIDKSFDDFLKKRYESHTIKPEKALWEGINTRLYQKKIDKGLRKVRYLKVAITSVAAILIGSLIYFEIRTRDYQPETQSVTEIAKIVHPADKSNDNILSRGQNNHNQKKNTDSLNNVSGLRSDKLVSKSDKIKSKLINQKVNSVKENTNAPNVEIQASSSSKRIIYKNPTSASSLAINSDPLKTHTLALETSRTIDSSIIRANNVEPIEKIMIPKGLEPGSLKLLKPITSVFSLRVRPGMDKSVNLQLAGSPEITQLSQKSDHGDLMLSGLNQNLSQSGESGLAKSGGKRLPFFVEAFVSPEISYRALAVNTQYSIPDYGKTYFNKKEKPDFTFSAGISGGTGITDNIILRSGIFYSRYSLRFKTEAIHLLNTGPDGNLVYTSSGLVNLQLLSSDSLSNESLLKSSLNFSYLNIPLIVELHFKNNYFINLGLDLNILVGQNMNWQAENYNGYFSNPTSKPINGLKSNSLSMILGVGTEKPISHNLSVIVNPTLKVNLGSMNNTAPVKSYPYVWGLNAGLRYYFN